MLHGRGFVKSNPALKGQCHVTPKGKLDGKFRPPPHNVRMALALPIKTFIKELEVIHPMQFGEYQ